MNHEDQSTQDHATPDGTERDARATISDAERLAEYREHVRRVVSHDLRSPLSAILIATEILQGCMPDSATEKVVERIVSCTNRTLRMLTDLVDYTNAYLGQGLVIEPEVYDINTIAQSASDAHQCRHPERVAELELAEEAVLAHVDATRVAQALDHLLNNAFVHGAAESPVRVTVSSTTDAAILEVHNRGDAIPDETLARLFEPFERASRSPTGFGLGLYIVQEIARAHGGRAELISSAAGDIVARITLARDLPASE